MNGALQLLSWQHFTLTEPDCHLSDFVMDQVESQQDCVFWICVMVSYVRT